MKIIDIEKLKIGDQIFAFDFNLLTWSKCEVTLIEKYLITLEDVEGTLKGIPWYETINRLKDPDYYRPAG
ncbi:hypothetical protein ES703_90601 [subsurface metagenome]